MLVKTFGSAVYGVEAITITVEVNVSSGKFTSIVGLADNAVKESLERMESAIKANGYHFPRTKVVVNLAPLISEKVVQHSIYQLPWEHLAQASN
jgi:Predicted ATPase with chaperone activity